MMPLFDAGFLRELEALHEAVLRLRGSAGEGLARAGRSLGQTEFSGHRPYAQGDDLRRLDWNAYGRLGRLFVREFERERREHLTLLLDDSRSMAAGDPPKHQFARRAAAAAGFLALNAGGSVSLCGGVVFEGASRFARWLDVLRAAEPRPDSNLARRVREAAALPRAPSDLWVISDFLEPLSAIEPLASLSQRRCAVTLVQVLAPQELAPPQRGTLELHGLEERQSLRLELDASSLSAYRAELEGHLELIESLALRHGWTYALAPSGSDLRALFTRGLRAGALP